MWAVFSHLVSPTCTSKDTKSQTALFCHQELLVCGSHSRRRLVGTVSMARALQADFLPLAGIDQFALSISETQIKASLMWRELFSWDEAQARGQEPRTLTKKHQPVCMIFCMHYTNLLNKMFF